MPKSEPFERRHAGARGRLTDRLSRRAAIASGFLMACVGRAAARADAAPSEAKHVRELVERVTQANAAFMRGDMKTWRRWASPIAADFTLMQPFGGPVTHGFDSSDAHLAELAGYFRSGVTRSEVVETYASPDMVVLVIIERQHAEVGGLPDQEWSLRVTQVFQRRGAEWAYVHRHADPLVRNIGLQAAAAISRGETGAAQC